jgi:hypothetical protein
MPFEPKNAVQIVRVRDTVHVQQPHPLGEQFSGVERHDMERKRRYFTPER